MIEFSYPKGQSEEPGDQTSARREQTIENEAEHDEDGECDESRPAIRRGDEPRGKRDRRNRDHGVDKMQALFGLPAHDQHPESGNSSHDEEGDDERLESVETSAAQQRPARHDE